MTRARFWPVLAAAPTLVGCGTTSTSGHVGDTLSASGGPAIGSYDFSMSLADGGQGQVKFPAQNYPDGFDVVRIGCARGWVVFEYPRPTRPSEIRFRFDDTGNNAGNVGGSRSETHERFSWKL